MAPKTKRSAETKGASKTERKAKQQKSSPDAKPRKSAAELKAEREQREADLSFETEYYILKKDPAELSIDELEKEAAQDTEWEGVRTAPAAKVLKTMQVGDKALFFSAAKKDPGIVAILEVTKAAYPDPTQFDEDSPHYDKKSTQEKPKWDAISVKLKHRIDSPITMTDLKEHKDSELSDLPLFTNKRLSIIPLRKAQWDFIVGLIPGYMPDDDEAAESAEEGAEDGAEEEGGKDADEDAEDDDPADEDST